MKGRNRIPFLAIAGLVIGSFFLFLHDKKSINERDNEKQIRDSLHTKELELLDRLKETESERDRLRYRIDSLTALHRDFLRKDSIRDLELRQVKGQFDKLNSSELRSKMIDEYQKAHNE